MFTLRGNNLIQYAIKVNHHRSINMMVADTPCIGKKIHDDVIKWKHFPRYWPFVRGIHRSPVNSPHKGQWRGALMFTLICVRINGWVNNREAGDLRRHRAHYDIIVMISSKVCAASPRNALFHERDMTVSQAFSPMAAQLSYESCAAICGTACDTGTSH